jgi:hypothetical protein
MTTVAIRTGIMTEITITTGVRSRLRELAANKAKIQTMDAGRNSGDSLEFAAGFLHCK